MSRTMRKGPGCGWRLSPLLLAALAVGAVCLGAPPSSAQEFPNYLGSYLQQQRFDNIREHQLRLHEQRLRQQQRAQPGAVTSPSDHQRACAQRYRTYNPQTDLYIARPGVTARCNL